MADLRCPNCGRDNPDFLDTCQFCQATLRIESTIQTGESPVKKNTGELEPILPQWLKDMRQQARDSAEEDAAASAAQPKVTNEPPDLLAGLASQGREEEDAIPDWLASISPVTKPKKTEPPESVSSNDFFSQFTKSAPEPAAPPQAEEQAAEEIPTWMGAASETPQAGTETDELSEWFTKAAAEPDQPIELENEPSADGIAPSFTIKEPEPPKEEEDLSWLHTLEATASQPAQPAAPEIEPTRAGEAGPSQPLGAGEDLSWLNNLGSVSTGASEEPEPSTPAVKPEAFVPEAAPANQDDLSWLDQLGDAAVNTQGEVPLEPALQDSPDWMKLPGEPASGTEEKRADDLGWLQPFDEKKGADSTADRVSPFVPRRTGPLEDGSDEESMPDWLKSATEEPLMPPPGALSDWFRESSGAAKDEAPLSAPEADSAGSDFSVPPQQDVESLLSGGMPDWFSPSESGAEEIPAGGPMGADSLAPVDLPAWVQAMRPVESVIAGGVDVDGGPAEREGPLAGLRGVIPAAPIGSALRPKAASLKLQASDEQQEGAALIEQILMRETNSKPPAAIGFVASQRVLRWVVSGLILLVLGAMAYLGTQSMPVSAELPAGVRSASGVIARLPQNSTVLVVIDYEPALASEMEAVSGPMLDQLVLTTRARLEFVSTSLNGTALVRRLLINTGISLPAPNGLDYKAGENYVNLGYLPGGFTGVRGFIDAPTSVLPQAGVNLFTDYAAVLVLTDHAESGRAWVEQLYARNQADPAYFSFQPILFASSAQAAPMLQPYVSSGQITGMVSGLADAVRYEFVNNSRPGVARRYWDSFGVGILLAIAIIAIGSLWSLAAGIRARRAEAGSG